MSDFSNSSNLSDELQSGRTRELLLLLQDKPVPEIQDPLNIQSGLSSGFVQDSSDYRLSNEKSSTVSRPSDNDSGSASKSELEGLIINPNDDLEEVDLTISSNTGTVTKAEVGVFNGSTIQSVTGSFTAGDTVTITASLSANTDHYVAVTNENGSWTSGQFNASFPYTSTFVDIVDGYQGGLSNGLARAIETVKGYKSVPRNSGKITDQFTSPTSTTADFKAWNSIRAEDVTTGGSTSANPVEFEILDSTDTVLNSSRIPKARIADEPFTMRNRVYSESATSNGQSDYTIATTGDGGHFGIPVLTVVSVKKNGSVLDSDNWSFDADTDTVTIDTSNVTIESGDTIDIKYDFDVVDSTLQPRAYLNRASSSETSPSISHFRYEYVI